MFTGIVEETGRVGSCEPIDGGIRMQISADRVLEDLEIGDSVSISGVCLTVVARDRRQFTIEAVGDTLDKTSLGTLQTGMMVNLERAVTAATRMGGHFVQGHVNAVGKILRWHPLGENWLLEVSIPESLMRYVIAEGSIAIDGISLTVASLAETSVRINIIPHTVAVTSLKEKSPGDPVNLEVDMIAKYIERLLTYRLPAGEVSP